MLQLQNASQMQAPWLHWLFYGETRSGKTTNAATFSRPLFLVPRNEGSMVTLRGRDVMYMEVEYTTLLPVVQEIALASRQQGDAWPYDTLVVESLSHYQEFVIHHLTNGHKLDMTQALWGKFKNHFTILHANLRALEMDVVFTALAKCDLDSNKVATGGPMLSGAAAKILPSSCDIIGYCEMIGGKSPVYRTHFSKFGPYAAGSRFARVPRMVENFSYANIEQFLI